MALGFENVPWRSGHFGPIFVGKVVLSSDHVLVRIELRGAIVGLAPKSKMAIQDQFSICHFGEFLLIVNLVM